MYGILNSKPIVCKNYSLSYLLMFA